METVQVQKKVPQLRFSEFEGEWEKKELGDVCRIFDGTHQTPKYVDEGVPFFSVEHLTSNQFTKTKFITEEVYLKENLRVKLEKGDVLMTRIGDIGTSKYIDWEIKGSFYVSLALLKCFDINSSFLDQAIGSNMFQRDLWSKTIHVAFPKKINLGDIKLVKITLPTLAEQEKIASFLGSVDRRISLLGQKKEALEAYKKGIMQQLFSQKIRFKKDDGTSFPDWEMKKLGEVCRIFDGTHQTPKYVEEGVPFFSVEHLTSNQFTKTKFITEEVYLKENLRVKLEKGDVLMTRIGDIGTSKYIDWEIKGSFYVSLALLKCFDINSSFLNQAIGSNMFQRDLWSKTIHVAFPKKINLGDIKLVKIFTPSHEEQQKIATFLESIDRKIEASEQELRGCQNFKKGLLQQMFV